MRASACMCVCVCVCVRVRLGSVSVCVGVFSSSLWCFDLDSELFHSNPGNTAEQSLCGSGRIENKFTIFLLVAEDFSRLHLFRDRWGECASLVEREHRHIFRGQTAVLWLQWWCLRLSGLKAVTAGGNSWTSDHSSGPGCTGKWIERVLLWNPEQDVLKVGIDVLNTNYTTQN